MGRYLARVTEDGAIILPPEALAELGIAKGDLVEVTPVADRGHAAVNPGVLRDLPLWSPPAGYVPGKRIDVDEAIAEATATLDRERAAGSPE